MNFLKVIPYTLVAATIYVVHETAKNAINLWRDIKETSAEIEFSRIDNENLGIEWTVAKEKRQLDNQENLAVAEQVRYANQTIMDKSKGLFGEANPIILLPGSVMNKMGKENDDQEPGSKGFMSTTENTC